MRKSCGTPSRACFRTWTVPDLPDRYRGTLLGLACGDALGAAVEGWSKPEIAARFGTLRDFQPSLHWARGETTDDTAQAIALAESLLAGRGFDAEDLMRRFATWLRAGGKGIGRTTYEAITAHLAGARASQASELAHRATGGISAGNGGLMRAAPVALRHRGDRTAIVAIARQQTAVTHFDPLAGHAAAALCVALDALLTSAEPAAAHAVALEYTSAKEPRLREYLNRAVLAEPVPAGYGGFAPETLEAGFWALLHAADPEDAIVRAVNLGGDNDTQGAVAGALAGAWGGASSLPDRWLQHLGVRDTMLHLSDRLLATTTEP